MNNTTHLKLIDGEFLPNDAQEILMNILTSKLNFHKLKNFSSNERYGFNDEIAQKRIPELTSDIAKLKELLKEARATNVILKISSEITISSFIG